jgi:hypothetical protein
MKIQSKLISDNKTFLSGFLRANDNDKRKFMRQATKDQRKALYEIFTNLLAGNIQLQKKTFVQLKKYKNVLRKLVNKKQSEKQKKKILNQKGRGVLPLLAIILPTVIETVLRSLT